MPIKRPAGRTTRRRVAVVEDDHAIGKMLKEVLALDGFEVVLMSDGCTAFDEVRRSGCQVVVLDLKLPGRDGIEIVHQLRDARDTKALPVVMLTGQSDDQTTWAGWKAGVNYFMSKPFDPQELVRVLNQVLS